MDDLISRQATIDEAYDIMIDGDIFRVVQVETLYGLPSAQSERKNGKWIYIGIRGRFPACQCSECGNTENADWASMHGVDYCPHCGAHMIIN